jgi:hypothetical protein
MHVNIYVDMYVNIHVFRYVYKSSNSVGLCIHTRVRLLKPGSIALLYQCMYYIESYLLNIYVDMYVNIHEFRYVYKSFNSVGLCIHTRVRLLKPGSIALLYQCMYYIESYLLNIYVDMYVNIHEFRYVYKSFNSVGLCIHTRVRLLKYIRVFVY